MSSYRELETIGSATIAGEAIEFLAARGFVTAQFVHKSPRGIANLVDLHTDQPRVVPLSHAAWIGANGCEQQLIAAALEALANRETSPPVPRSGNRDGDDDLRTDWNATTAGPFNRRRTPSIRTR
jgi:uncharacterized phosphosugar-binding protein